MLQRIIRLVCRGERVSVVAAWRRGPDQPCKDERLPRGNSGERRWYSLAPPPPAERAVCACAVCCQARGAPAGWPAGLGWAGRGLLRTINSFSFTTVRPARPATRHTHHRCAVLCVSKPFLLIVDIIYLLCP